MPTSRPCSSSSIPAIARERPTTLGTAATAAELDVVGAGSGLLQQAVRVRVSAAVTPAATAMLRRMSSPICAGTRVCGPDGVNIGTHGFHRSPGTGVATDHGR